MERQRRWGPEESGIAQINLRKLISLMKKEAVFLGETDRLDNAYVPGGSPKTAAASRPDHIRALAVLAAQFRRDELTQDTVRSESSARVDGAAAADL